MHSGVIRSLLIANSLLMILQIMTSRAAQKMPQGPQVGRLLYVVNQEQRILCRLAFRKVSRFKGVYLSAMFFFFFFQIASPSRFEPILSRLANTLSFVQCYLILLLCLFHKYLVI